MRIARSLGISLRRFLGWQPATWTNPATGYTRTEPEYDEWERGLWRELAAYEASLCPDCGNDLHDALWDDTKPLAEQAKWRASYRQCRSCLELENAQIKQRDDDEQAAKQAGPHALPTPTRHRKWVVERDDERGR